MRTTQAQIKLNLPLELKAYVQTKADKYGLTLASYVRHLIIKDAETPVYPMYKASKKTEEAYKRAIGAERKGKTIKVKNIERFFSEL